MGIPQSTPESALSNYICSELSKLDHVGMLSEDIVMARNYHAWRGDSGPNTNECAILLNPITIKISPDQYPTLPLTTEIKIKQDVRTYNGKCGWNYGWALNKFELINPADSNLTSQQIMEINNGIEMANKKIVHPTWFDETQCKKLCDEVKYHPIIK